MRSFRVCVGSAAFCGCLFASGLFTGGAAAQSAEPVGGPLQLLKLITPGKSEARPHAKPATARSVTERAAKSSTKSSTKTRVASRKKSRSYFAVAERKRRQVESALQAAAPPASNDASPAAPTAMTADAATLAPVQQMQAAPQIVAPTAGTPSQLIVDGQIIQVASADEANEIDLAAANDAAAARNASLGPKLAISAPTAAVVDPATKSEPITTTLVEAQTSDVSTTSWILQILAALGGAVAAGTVAWLLMRSVPRRIEVSE